MKHPVVIALVTFVVFGVLTALIIPFFHPSNAEAAGSAMFPVGLVAGVIAFFVARSRRNRGNP